MIASGDDRWKLCIDFGTALSKAAAAPAGVDLSTRPELARPLALAAAAGARNPFLLPGAIFLEGQRVHLGPQALRRSEEVADPKREALQSFKTLLGARDLESSLEQILPRAIDPDGAFHQRDLIVTYLAYLTWLAHSAIRADAAIDADPETLMRRYARPAWNSAQSQSGHQRLARLFDEAQALACDLDAELIAPAGLRVITLREALDRVRTATLGPSMVEGAVFEAAAAAACHFGKLGKPDAVGPMVLLTLDIGAGTTDMAALRVEADGRCSEILEARQTILSAGDAIDKMLLNLFLEKAKAAKTVEARTALWRSMLTQARSQKEQLFVEKRAAIRFEGKVITVQLKDLEGSPDFRGLRKDIAHAYAVSLEAAAVHAANWGEKEVAVVVAGGGSRLPFVQDLVRSTKPRKGGVKARLAPITPEWAHADVFGGNLAPILPQLAIAIGGAIAPTSLLMARSDDAIAA